MKKFEKFLFFYSILSVTIFFISFGAYSPSPLNFISGVMMLPTTFYFWIRLTGPDHTTADVWSVRFLISLAILALIGIFGFYLASKAMPQVKTLNTRIVNLENQISKLTEELDIKTAELGELKEKPATPSATVKGTATEEITVADLVVGTPKPGSQRITGNPGVAKIDVYQSSTLNSTKIGTIETGITYPYITKENGMYKIVLTTEKTGWVSQNQVQEVQ